MPLIKWRWMLFLVFFVMSLFTKVPNVLGARSDSRGRYDKSVSLFDPEGSNLQIRYADKAGENGMTLVCVVTSNNSVILCSPSATSHCLMDKRCIDKVSQVDEGIWIAFAGLVGDGRHITRRARQYCNNHLSKFGCRPTVAALAKHVGSLQHEASLKGGERPLGLHVLCVGFDEAHEKTKNSVSEPKKTCPPVIFVSKSSGEVRQWRAVAIGKHAEKALSLLEDRIGSSISEVEASEIAEYVISCVTDDSSTTGIDSYLLRLDDSLREKPVYSKTLKRIQNNSQ